MKLFLEISGSIIVGLFVIPFTIATIRAIVDGASPQWIQGDVVIAERKSASETWIRRIPVAFDIWFNVTFLNGEQDETISTHSYRASVEGKPWGKWMVAWLDLWQSNHGQKAASGDLERAQNRVNVLSALLGVK